MPLTISVHGTRNQYGSMTSSWFPTLAVTSLGMLPGWVAHLTLTER